MKNKRPSKRNSIKENKKFPYKRLHSRRKELNPDGSNTGLAETRSESGEETKDEQMPEDTENHVERILRSKRGWGQPYGY